VRGYLRLLYYPGFRLCCTPYSLSRCIRPTPALSLLSGARPHAQSLILLQTAARRLHHRDLLGTGKLRSIYVSIYTASEIAIRTCSSKLPSSKLPLSINSGPITGKAELRNLDKLTFIINLIKKRLGELSRVNYGMPRTAFEALSAGFATSGQVPSNAFSWAALAGKSRECDPNTMTSQNAG
jgi:hypothetical protein